MAKVTFDTERCKGCGLCVKACPKNLVRLGSTLNSRGYHSAEITNAKECVGCAFCATMCPDCVVTVER